MAEETIGQVAVPRGQDADRDGLREVVVQVLSFTARVASNCPEVRRHLAALYPVAAVPPQPCAPPSGPLFVVRHFSGSRDARRYRLHQGDQLIAAFDAAADAVSHLELLINAAAVGALGSYLFVHAGVVASADGAVVLPGASGLGKSTLVTALSLAGFAYLSDEVAVFDGQTSMVLPFLKPICLKEGGARVLAQSVGLGRPALSAVRADGEMVHYLPPPRWSPPDRGLPVRHVLIPMRRPAGNVRLKRVSPATALIHLAEHSLNLPRHGAAGVELLARVVEGADSHVLTYADPRGAVDAIAALFGHPRRRRGVPA